MENNSHDILIFATNIRSKQGKDSIGKVLNKKKGIISWSIDQEDKDRVLRIESKNTTPDQIIKIVNRYNFKCKELE